MIHLIRIIGGDMGGLGLTSVDLCICGPADRELNIKPTWSQQQQQQQDVESAPFRASSAETLSSLDRRATTEKTSRVSPLSREMKSSSWCSSRADRVGEGFSGRRRRWRGEEKVEEGAGRDYFLSALQADYKLQLYCEGWCRIWACFMLRWWTPPRVLVLYGRTQRSGAAGRRGAADMKKWLHGSVERIVMSVCESLELLPLSMVLLPIKHV